MALVCGALFRQRFIQQPLVFRHNLAFQFLADNLVRGREDRVGLEELPQRIAFTPADLEGDDLVIGAEPLHASRSMVACSVYFCNWCT